MPADLRGRLQYAAAKSNRDAPLALVEWRLHHRHNLRRAAAALATVVVVAGIGGGIALSTDDGPTVRTGRPAAATAAGLTVDLPPGWVQSDTTSTGARLLVVGTKTIPAGASGSACSGLVDSNQPSSEAFVQIGEPGSGIQLMGGSNQTLDVPSRPDDFSNAPTIAEGACGSGDASSANLARAYMYAFRDGGRVLLALVTIGTSAPATFRDEAYAVLNSLQVEGAPPISFVPVPTMPPSTVPPSADTQAIDATFHTWLETKPRDDPSIAAVIEDYAAIKASIDQAAASAPLPLDAYHGRVDSILRVGTHDAELIYSILNGEAVVVTTTGRAVKIDGVWKVSRETVCDALAIGGTQCPPRKS